MMSEDQSSGQHSDPAPESSKSLALKLSRLEAQVRALRLALETDHRPVDTLSQISMIVGGLREFGLATLSQGVKIKVEELLDAAGTANDIAALHELIRENFRLPGAG